MVATCNLHLGSRNHGVQTKINKCMFQRVQGMLYESHPVSSDFTHNLHSKKQQLCAWFDSYWKSLEPPDFNTPFVNVDQINAIKKKGEKSFSSLEKLKPWRVEYSLISYNTAFDETLMYGLLF